MKWSFRIFTFAGTEVRIHVTFFLLLLFVASQSFLGGHGITAALESTLFILTMFTCVLLHEFGHVLAARGYGIRTPASPCCPSAAWHDSSACHASPRRSLSSPSVARWSM